MATTREPNIQSTERDPKQNMIATMNQLYFQVLFLNVFQFQLNRNVFHRYDDEFFVRNLESSVDKALNSASHHKGLAIYIIVPGHNKCSPFPFSSARVSYEILSKASSLFSMNSYMYSVLPSFQHSMYDKFSNR